METRTRIMAAAWRLEKRSVAGDAAGIRLYILGEGGGKSIANSLDNARMAPREFCFTICATNSYAETLSYVVAERNA